MKSLSRSRLAPLAAGLALFLAAATISKAGIGFDPFPDADLRADLDSLEAGQSGSDEIYFQGKFDQPAGTATPHGAFGWYERYDNAAIGWDTTAVDTLYDANENPHLPFKPHMCRVCFVADTSLAPVNDTLHVIGATWAWGTRTLTDPDTVEIVFSASDSLNTFRETPSTKGFLGDILVERVSQPDSARSTNIFTALVKDNFGIDFTVRKLEIDGSCNGTETAFDVWLFHHQTEGWTFAAGGMTMPDDFPPVICSTRDDYGDEYDRLALQQGWGYRTEGLNVRVNADSSEGVVLMLDTTVNETIEGNFRLVGDVKQ